MGPTDIEPWGVPWDAIMSHGDPMEAIMGNGGPRKSYKTTYESPIGVPWESHTSLMGQHCKILCRTPGLPWRCCRESPVEVL